MGSIVYGNFSWLEFFNLFHCKRLTGNLISLKHGNAHAAQVTPTTRTFPSRCKESING